MNSLRNVIFLSLLFGALTACAGKNIKHDYFMRGQVVEIDGAKAVFCIGSSDGAKIGQQLDAYRIETGSPIIEEGGSYKRVMVGSVKIDSIINEHFAQGSVLNGNLEVHDIVELKVVN